MIVQYSRKPEPARGMSKIKRVLIFGGIAAGAVVGEELIRHRRH